MNAYEILQKSRVYKSPVKTLHNNAVKENSIFGR